VRVRAPSSTSLDPERLTKAAELIAQTRAGLKVALSMLEEARSGKDMLKLNCVNEKLTNIKGLVRISEQAEISLQEVMVKREEQAAEHEYQKILIASQKVQQLKAEAEGCVGMLAFETGPTEIVVEEPSDLPMGRDPWEESDDTRPIFYGRLPAASPMGARSF
jgi:hypothetical protein